MVVERWIETEGGELIEIGVVQSCGIYGKYQKFIMKFTNLYNRTYIRSNKSEQSKGDDKKKQIQK